MNININLKDAFILSIFCILIVFFVLMVISLSVNLIRIFMYKQEDLSKTKYTSEMKKRLEENHNLKFDEIKDDDMLIAAFVASIDAIEENDNKTVRIKSIKRI